MVDISIVNGIINQQTSLGGHHLVAPDLLKMFLPQTTPSKNHGTSSAQSPGPNGPRRQYENAVCQCQAALELVLWAIKLAARFCWGECPNPVKWMYKFFTETSEGHGTLERS